MSCDKGYNSVLHDTAGILTFIAKKKAGRLHRSDPLSVLYLSLPDYRTSTP